MTITLTSLEPVVAIACGGAILIWPRLLNYIVAGYPILSGLLGLGVVSL